jgi:hypothetical protein
MWLNEIWMHVYISLHPLLFNNPFPFDSAMLHPALTPILVIFTLLSHTEPEYSDWHMQTLAQPNLT